MNSDRKATINYKAFCLDYGHLKRRAIIIESSLRMAKNSSIDRSHWESTGREARIFLLFYDDLIQY